MNNITFQFWEGEIVLPFTNDGEGILNVISQAKGAVSTVTIPDAITKTAKKINYTQLATQLDERIKQGLSRVELFNFMNAEMHFTDGILPQWERMAFPRMHGEGLARFHTFCKAVHMRNGTNYNAYKTSYGIMNLESTNTPDKKSSHDQELPTAKIDAYTQNLLFGWNNMAKIDTLFGYSPDGSVNTSEDNSIWINSMTYKWRNADEQQKVQYLIDWLKYDIRDPNTWQPDWSKLTGIRFADGGFFGSDGFYASGSLDGDDVRRLWLDLRGSDVGLGIASDARLCFLA